MNDIQFLEHMVKSLVDYPDAVTISRTLDDMGVFMTVQVDKDDIGRIIGREGNTAKAIRTLLRVYGMRTSARINMKIVEPTQ